ncbi:hypothetical protein MRQ36_09135 [Micromonospora sp. R77]|uniref:hypothetical protein n=1 Tax=Micromonospora sp. R77 TaxID=2925836 RepID=UPI001F61A34F|nr:hypothetical protein [Micromonospora sp. R77]MCI4062726.1 hypothetical protein [Micromonospora sp. R77]
MAFRTWGRLLLTALGVSVLAGAGQLGIAYGFGIVRLGGTFTDGTVNRWPAQLVWVGWFAAIAAVAGAVLTERLARRDGFPGGTTEQLSVAGAAALGATVVAPLCMQPARAAELNSVDPVWAVGICAVLGAVVGAGAALAVLLRPPLGWNIAMTVGVVWLLALVSVAPSIASTGPLPTVRLGVLEPSWLDAATAQRLAVLILPTVALLAGAAIGALARRWEQPPLVGGAAGAAGPVLVAFAYLAAGPGDPADRYQLAPYYGALIAVATGALGSTAATLLRRPVGAPGHRGDRTERDPPAAAGRDRRAGAPDRRRIHTRRHRRGGRARRPLRHRAGRRGVAQPGALGLAGPAGSNPAPVPAGLPPARRTSAIDVLAGPPARTPDTGTGTGDRTPSTPPAATVAQPTTPSQPTAPTQSTQPADPAAQPAPATPADRTTPAAKQQVTAGTPVTPAAPVDATTAAAVDATTAAPAGEDTPAPTAAASTTRPTPAVTPSPTSNGPADAGTGTSATRGPPTARPPRPAPTSGRGSPSSRRRAPPPRPAAPSGPGSRAPPPHRPYPREPPGRPPRPRPTPRRRPGPRRRRPRPGPRRRLPTPPRTRHPRPPVRTTRRPAPRRPARPTRWAAPRPAVRAAPRPAVPPPSRQPPPPTRTTRRPPPVRTPRRTATRRPAGPRPRRPPALRPARRPAPASRSSRRTAPATSGRPGPSPRRRPGRSPRAPAVVRRTRRRTAPADVRRWSPRPDPGTGPCPT